MVLRVVIIITIGFQVMLNITRPVVTLFASHLGANTFEIGMVTAFYAFFPLFFAIYAGKISDYVGDRLPIILGTVGMTVGMAFPFCYPSMWSLYTSQAIIGVSQLFINISLQNVLGNAATPKNRDQYFSIFSMAMSLGSVIGPVVGGYLVEHFSYTFAFLVSMFTGLIPIAISFFIPVIIRKNEQSDHAFSGSMSLLKIPILRKALVSSALVLYSRDIFVAYFPLFAKQQNILPSVIGWIIAIQGISMVAVRFFLPKLIIIFGRNRILLASIFTAGISFFLVPFTSHFYFFCVLSALMGAGLGCGQPLSMTTTYNASPKMRTGEVLGLRLASNRLSQLIAPLFFGLVGSSVGLVSVFYVSSALLIGGAYLTRSNADEQ
ncbi:MFS family permease [Paenibacillus sp. V4I3]|uniref:MFS transporter n=1 Tax=unclassified Paenibacillus TaxID=185978 RepID=UPI002789A72C|nr:MULTISPECIES: MFS transporter [unclassified Paenibacillus]MDQ0876086.1 MFS family permease [Paenibacillus sp. V4I3]MDQ0887966.1 MFS family permease [Paenibacillus sp. V4I9]